jgi:hypothetical protein
MRLTRVRRWLSAVCAALVAQMVQAEGVITGARYIEPTTRYPHAVLGDDVEWGALSLSLGDCGACAADRTVVIRLPETRVFEDTAPRLIDLYGTGAPVAVVVESDARHGARLALYDADGLITATPFIGTRFRWLAPLGAADLDGDGLMELAYIDRPHLAKTLRIWRFDPRDDSLTQIAHMPGLTNHRIGEPDIAGGIRTCTSNPEMIVATANWNRLIAATLKNGDISLRDIGPHQGRASFARALRCQ